MKLTVSRKGYFSAAHRLYNKNLNYNDNLKIFGKCSYLNYHGHNYKFIISVKGQLEKETGFVISIKNLKNIIKNEIEEYFDHKNLNIDIPEFHSVNPTMENIILVIWNRVKKKISNKYILKVILYETNKNFVEYDGS